MKKRTTSSTTCRHTTTELTPFQQRMRRLVEQYAGSVDTGGKPFPEYLLDHTRGTACKGRSEPAVRMPIFGAERPEKRPQSSSRS